MSKWNNLIRELKSICSLNVKVKAQALLNTDFSDGWKHQGV